MNQPTDPFTPDTSSNLSTSPMPDWNYPFFSGGPMLPPEMEDFRLCEILGSGSTGTIYRSIQTREYAVKVIPWYPNNLREVARREYEIGRQFAECETVIHVLSYYEHNTNSILLQELGKPVLQYLPQGKCTLRIVLQVLLDVADALSFIHAKGYTHFDVKPDNIMIVKERGRLGDFSHCLRYLPGQEYERFLGTSAFMAPEIRPGAKHSGLEDMYSLGITMYSLLMGGHVPAEEKNGDGTRPYRQIRSVFLPPDLLSIIQKAAAYEPQDRYPDFEAFSKDVRSFMEANPDALEEDVPGYRMCAFHGEQTFPPFFNQAVTDNMRS